MLMFSSNKVVLSFLVAVVAIGAASSAVFAAKAEDRDDYPTESNKCTDAWAKAFHKANGEDAPISYDQAWEFVDNCRAGKHPPKTSK